MAAYRSRSGDVQRAAEKLAQVDARVIGVVLNEAAKQGSGYYSDYGRHGSYYGRLPELSAVSVPMQASGNGDAPARLNGAAGDHRKPRWIG